MTLAVGGQGQTALGQRTVFVERMEHVQQRTFGARAHAHIATGQARDGVTLSQRLEFSEPAVLAGLQ